MESILRSKRKVSLTTLLVAVYIDALQASDINVFKNKKRPVAVQVPVNIESNISE